jgi:hypothetical protein
MDCGCSGEEEGGGRDKRRQVTTQKRAHVRFSFLRCWSLWTRGECGACVLHRRPNDGAGAGRPLRSALRATRARTPALRPAVDDARPSADRWSATLGSWSYCHSDNKPLAGLCQGDTNTTPWSVADREHTLYRRPDDPHRAGRLPLGSRHRERQRAAQPGGFPRAREDLREAPALVRRRRLVVRGCGAGRSVRAGDRPSRRRRSRRRSSPIGEMKIGLIKAI